MGLPSSVDTVSNYSELYSTNVAPANSILEGHATQQAMVVQGVVLTVV